MRKKCPSVKFHGQVEEFASRPPKIAPSSKRKLDDEEDDEKQDVPGAL